MPFPGWIGPLLSGLGSLGGAFGGLFGKSGNMRNYPLTRMVADAKKAGIHPLAALGAQSLGAYAQPVSSWNAGDAIGAALQGLGGVGASLYEQDEEAADRRREAAWLARMESNDRRSQLRATARDRWERSMEERRLRLSERDMMLREATSRSLLSAGRAAGQGGAFPTSSTVATDSVPAMSGNPYIYDTVIGPIYSEPGGVPSSDLENRYGEGGDAISILQMLKDIWSSNAWPGPEPLRTYKSTLPRG